MFEKLNEKMTFYKVRATNKTIQEDGKYHTAKVEGDMIGYEAYNTETGIVEFTSMRLPEVVFQADYLDKALESFLTDEQPETGEAAVVEDVVPASELN